MSLASGAIQVVTKQIRTILHLFFTWFEDKRVSRLDVVVDDVVGKDSTLSLWQEEERKFLVLLALVDLSSLMWIMDVENTSCKSGSHLTTVVSVHTEGATLAERLVTIREFAETTSSKDRRVCGLEVAVHNQTAVVDESIVVNALENILINVFMSAGDQYLAFNF